MDFLSISEYLLEDLRFNLFDCLHIEDSILGEEAFEQFDADTCHRIFEDAGKFAFETLAPNYRLASEQGCTLEEPGSVTVPAAYYDMWKQFTELGWGGLSAPTEYGGQGAPYVLGQAVQELFYAADTAFMIFSGFCVPGTYLLDCFGDDFLKTTFCHKLVANQWSASLVMTEPDAGSDLSNVSTTAVRNPDGTFSLEGTKIFISAGDQDLTENIVYFVLARTTDDSGRPGLSCFVVPKFLPDSSGEISERNGIFSERLEKKMGLHACPTVQLSLGARSPAIGYLLGERLGLGLQQMFSMMSQARITTGIMGTAIATSAYRFALEYAKERKQGVAASAVASKTSKRVPIIEHADVRRMLLDMKAKTEGCRALYLRLAYYNTRLMLLQGMADQAALSQENEAERKQAQLLVELLTPLLKAYSSDQSWRVCETGIQVMGGYGFMSDYPMSHWCCDVKILSIWEGTNFIQSQDLVRNKLALGRKSRYLGAYAIEIQAFIVRNRCSDTELHGGVLLLEAAWAAFADLHAQMGVWLSERKLDAIYGAATRILSIFAELTLGWLLLEGAEVALRKCRNSADDAYLRGKIDAALYYIDSYVAVLPARVAALSANQDAGQFIEVRSL